MTTTITNTSGKDKVFFGFIPPHGRSLRLNETIVIDGSVRTMQADERWRSQTTLEYMKSAIAHGLVAVCEHLECESSSSS